MNKLEPADPDQINDGERAHVSDHIIRNVSKVSNGVVVRGITDNACVGCHQGSNRTVLQYWGIRLDQNADLTNNTQYPENPVTFTNTANDRRLFDPAVNNNTFNGRNADQYILTEDYDGDGLDDTPPDVHYESGMGCIDCHGSRDLHGGTKGDVTSGKIMSRQDQSTAIACESCHGNIEDYAATAPCEDYQGQQQTCAVDRFGNTLRHVIKDPQDNFWLTSRVYGTLHYVPQTRDLVYNTNKTNPRTGNLLYSPKAAYSMGRINGTPGSGPVQTNPRSTAKALATQMIWIVHHATPHGLITVLAVTSRDNTTQTLLNSSSVTSPVSVFLSKKPMLTLFIRVRSQLSLVSIVVVTSLRSILPRRCSIAMRTSTVMSQMSLHSLIV